MTCKDGRFNTGNDLCSNDLRDLNDNSIIVDGYVNSQELYVEDRLGVERLTLTGIQNKFDKQYQDAQGKIDGFGQLIEDKIIAQGGVEVVSEWSDSVENPPSVGFLKGNLGYVTPEMFGAKGDSVTDDTDAVKAALDSGKNVYFTNIYRVTELKDHLYSFSTFGQGGVICDGNTTYADQNKGDVNIYVKTANGYVGSGLSVNDACSMTHALQILRKRSNYSKVVSIVFTLPEIELDSHRLSNMPVFNTGLFFKGVDGTGTTVKPMTGVAGYCFFSLQNSGLLMLNFRNINFEGWKMNSNSGAICIWNKSVTTIRDCNFTECYTGVTVRQSYLQVHDSNAYKCATPYVISYNSYGNVGSLSQSKEMKIEEASVFGVDVGRNSSCYIQNVDFYKCDVDIHASRLSRFRSQRCKHREWVRFAYYLTTNSVQTPDNGSGNPDTFSHSDSTKPVLNLSSGSIHSHVYRGGTGGIHTSSLNRITLSGSQSNTWLASVNGAYTPMRLPEYTFFTPGIHYKCELMVGQINSDLTLDFKYSRVPLLSYVSPTTNKSKIISFNIVTLGDGRARVYIEEGGEVIGLKFIPLSSIAALTEDFASTGTLYVTSSDSINIEYMRVTITM